MNTEQIHSKILRRIRQNDPGIVYKGDVQSMAELEIPEEYRHKEPFWNLYIDGNCTNIYVAPHRDIKITPSYQLDDCVEGAWSYGTCIKYAYLL